MLKKAVWIALSWIGISTACYAVPATGNKADIQFNVSSVIYQDGEVDDAESFFGRWVYNFNDYLAIGVEGGFYTDSGIDEVGVDDAGELTDIATVFGDLIARYPTGENCPVLPYVVAGVGGVFWGASAEVAGVDLNVDDAFAVKVGGGVDWFIDDHWAVNFEGAYIFTGEEVIATGPGDTTGHSDLNHVVFGVVVKYLF